MAEKIALDVVAGRRHIVERPRLSRLLDETDARVIMLIAPAGYGKTTLARQWLSARPHVWYQAGSAASDVAALALSLARTLEPFAPSASEALQDRLRAVPDAPRELSVLVDIQAEALKDWPEGAWLMIDDYHRLALSPFAESYVRLLLRASPIQLILTSRSRPQWATPRGVLYGELFELGRLPLAMNEDEATAVFGGSAQAHLRGLVSLAEGWPAVIGLAALTQMENIEEKLPETLFDFFADELYDAASPVLQRALRELALAPRLTADLARGFLGPRRAPRLLDEARNLGFVTTAGSEPELHPLLRAFLVKKLESAPGARRAAARKLADLFLARDDWDAAFELFELCAVAESLIRLIEHGLDPMLREGRLDTVAGWLERADELRVNSPIVELARAELMIRRGSGGAAEAVALGITKDEAASAVTRSRAYSIAGRAAHLDNREDVALRHFRDAGSLAATTTDRRDAVWGALLCAPAIEDEDELQACLTEFVADIPEGPEDILRSGMAHLIVALIVGGLPEALAKALAVSSALARASDPLVRTSFRNAVSRSLSLLGRYDEAAVIADEMIEEAQRTRLDFVLPHAFLAKAEAQIGLQRYGEAEIALTTAGEHAEEIGDRHNVLDVQIARSKLAIAAGDFDRALALTSTAPHASGVTAVVVAERAAARGLAHACNGNECEANSAFKEAFGRSTVPEVAALVECGRAVVYAKSARSPNADVSGVLSPVFQQELLDPVIIACRGCPELRRLIEDLDEHSLPLELATALAPKRRAGHNRRTDARKLSPREAEVLDLLALGYTNKEIAAALVIEEVTVKVHVRRVLQKLGVRSRTQAALAAVKKNGPE